MANKTSPDRSEQKFERASQIATGAGKTTTTIATLPVAGAKFFGSGFIMAALMITQSLFSKLFPDIYARTGADKKFNEWLGKFGTHTHNAVADPFNYATDGIREVFGEKDLQHPHTPAQPFSGMPSTSPSPTDAEQLTRDTEQAYDSDTQQTI